MTQDRDFKKVVRKRMARTGETYASARAKLRPKYSFENLTQEAKLVLARAEVFARADRRPYIGTDHLVLGALKTLPRATVYASSKSGALEETVVPGDGLRPSREAEEALLRAFTAAREESVTDVTVDHLLQGIAAVSDSRGAAMLGIAPRKWAPLFGSDLSGALGKAQRLAMDSGAFEVTLEHLKAVLEPAPGPTAGSSRSAARRAARPSR